MSQSLPGARRDGVLELADGRRLGFCDTGPDGARCVLLLHGTPGSRRFLPPGTPADVRVVTFDRPGYGTSDPMPDRSLLDTAADAVALVDHLGLERVAVVGWSGGCPTAAATLVRLGAQRVTGAAMVSGPGPLDEVPGAWEMLGPLRRPNAELARAGEPARVRRRILATMAPFVAEPAAFLGGGGAGGGGGGSGGGGGGTTRGNARPNPDGVLVGDPAYRPMLVEQLAEGLRGGADGVADDLIAMWLPFGFALADIPVPLSAFHGGRDRDNGADLRAYAAAAPGGVLRTWDDLGHFALLVRWPEVLDTVLGTGTGTDPGNGPGPHD